MLTYCFILGKNKYICVCSQSPQRHCILDEGGCSHSGLFLFLPRGNKLQSEENPWWEQTDRPPRSTAFNGALNPTAAGVGQSTHTRAHTHIYILGVVFSKHFKQNAFSSLTIINHNLNPSTKLNLVLHLGSDHILNLNYPLTQWGPALCPHNSGMISQKKEGPHKKSWIPGTHRDTHKLVVVCS